MKEMDKGRARPSMCTFSGVKFFPLNPDPSRIWLADVAHHLSMTCRYRGACRQFYSVAQHSVAVLHGAASLERREVGGDPFMAAKWGLLHDAAEAYLCDMVSPLKPHLPSLAEHEERLTRAVAERFGLSWPVPPSVKQADRDAFLAEMGSGLMPRPSWWSLPEVVPVPSVHPKGPTEAEREFLAWAEFLFGDLEYDRLLAPKVRPGELDA